MHSHDTENRGMHKRGSHASRTGWELRNNAQSKTMHCRWPFLEMVFLCQHYKTISNSFVQPLYPSYSRIKPVTSSLGSPFRRPQVVLELAPKRTLRSVRPRCLPHSLKSSSPSTYFAFFIGTTMGISTTVLAMVKREIERGKKSQRNRCIHSVLF